MSETKDYTCIFMTMSKNTRCTKTATKIHPDFSSINIESENVFCTVHYNYMIKHADTPALTSGTAFFGCSKTKRMIDMLEIASSSIRDMKLFNSLISETDEAINSCIEEEKKAFDVIMEEFLKTVNYEKARIIIEDKKKNTKNKSLRLEVDKLKSSLLDDAPIKKFSASYTVTKLYDHLDIYGCEESSYVNVTEEMEEEFYFYRKIREEIMIDYQLRMNRLIEKEKESKRKIIKKYPNQTKRISVRTFLMRKEGSVNVTTVDVEGDMSTMNHNLKIKTPIGDVVCNERLIYNRGINISETATTIDDVLVDMDDVEDFDDYFKFPKESISKALSCKNIAKQVMDFIGADHAFDLHYSINSAKISAPIHNYFRLEKTNFFPRENIENIYMYFKKNDSNVYSYIFKFAFSNDDLLTVKFSEDPLTNKKGANKDSDGNIYFDIFSLCKEIFLNIPEKEDIISNLLSVWGVRKSSIISAKRDILTPVERPVLKFLDRKQLSDSDIKSLANLKKNIIPQIEIGVNNKYPYCTVDSERIYIQLNMYFVKHIESVMNMTF